MTPLADVLWVSINLVFAYQGALQVGHLLRFSYISPALQWNMAVIYAVVPIGFALMSFRIIEGYWCDWRRGTLGQALQALDGPSPGYGPDPEPAEPAPSAAPGAASGPADAAAPSRRTAPAGRTDGPGDPDPPAEHEADPRRPTGRRDAP